MLERGIIINLYTRGPIRFYAYGWWTFFKEGGIDGMPTPESYNIMEGENKKKMSSISF